VTSFRYKAFISYSHQDERWARWLQHALESYRVPGRLIGKQGSFGEIPARLAPVFRDREDLSSAASLTESVQHELAAAETLVVICSPAAAQSRWVSEEIEAFAALGRTDRIYTLIVEGDPQAADPAERCFPNVLVEDKGSGALEPLAADARKWADGKVLAKLKLVAGILGIRLDELRQREMQRRRWLWLISLVSAVLITIIVVLAITARIVAENRRSLSQDLVGFKLKQLGGLLNPQVQLDLNELVGNWDVDIQAALPHGDTSDPLLERLAMDLRREGISARDEGRLADALATFQHSRLLLAELYRREIHEQDRLFELGQAEFWEGYIHWDMGELESAKEKFTVYAEITMRLVRANPANAEWVLELVYSLTNLGYIEKARENSDSENAIQLMQLALEFNQIALVLEPGNDVFRRNLGPAHANLADAWLSACNLGRALDSQIQRVDLAQEFLAAAPEDNQNKEDLAYALSGMAKVQLKVGLIAQSLENFKESQMLLAELSEQDPKNVEFRNNLLEKDSFVALLLFEGGEINQSWRLATELYSRWNETGSIKVISDVVSSIEYADFLIWYSEMALIKGEHVKALELLSESIDLLRGIITDDENLHRARLSMGKALYLDWYQSGTTPESDLKGLTYDYYADSQAPRACEEASLAARQAIMQGDEEATSSYTSYLLGRGYFEPGFIRLCKKYAFCGDG